MATEATRHHRLLPPCPASADAFNGLIWVTGRNLSAAQSILLNLAMTRTLQFEPRASTTPVAGGFNRLPSGALESQRPAP